MALSLEPQVVSFVTQHEWEAWLAQNFMLHEGIWLKLYKKNSLLPSITYAEALDVALCYGWIDGQMRGGDEIYWLQRFTPRRPKSVWSQVNQGHIARLTAVGRMQSPGILQVENAKKDGRWDAAYAPQSKAIVPEDFQRALEAHPTTLTFFESLSKAHRYTFLYRLQSIKNPERRMQRIQLFIEMLAKREHYHSVVTEVKN
jgi:uncharacterized protein YdeI (YjbR/CyaY-like superfamily)